MWHIKAWKHPRILNGEYFKPLGRKISRIHCIPKRSKKVQKKKQWPFTIGWSFYMVLCDWLKGALWPRLVWILNELNYSYCSFVAWNTPYFPWSIDDDEQLVLNLLLGHPVPWRDPLWACRLFFFFFFSPPSSAAEYGILGDKHNEGNLALTYFRKTFL